MSDLHEVKLIQINSKRLELHMVNQLGWTRVYISDDTGPEFIGASSIDLLYERIVEWLEGRRALSHSTIQNGTEFVPLLILNERHCYLGGAPDKSVLFVFDGDTQEVPLIEKFFLSDIVRRDLASALKDLVGRLKSLGPESL